MQALIGFNFGGSIRLIFSISLTLKVDMLGMDVRIDLEMDWTKIWIQRWIIESFGLGFQD